jgi:hypothetical protein
MIISLLHFFVKQTDQPREYYRLECIPIIMVFSQRHRKQRCSIFEAKPLVVRMSRRAMMNKSPIRRTGNLDPEHVQLRVSEAPCLYLFVPLSLQPVLRHTQQGPFATNFAL